jgi:7-carboxy-7-deazaguanine synthase
MAKPLRLRVNEIFFSLQGETTRSGQPCVFVRLTGCDLRCAWCDTEYAFYEGRQMALADVHGEVRRYPCRLVEFTGGEPMLQHRAMVPLMRRLLSEGYDVMVETSGARDVSPLPREVIKIVDLKCPASGECERNVYANLEFLGERDEVKFVIADRGDYEWARDKTRALRLAERCPVLFAPAWGRMAPAALVEWILEDSLPVRFQPQLHKMLWGERRGA